MGYCEHLAFTQASLFLDIGGKTRHGRDTVKSDVCGVIVCVRVLLCDMLWVRVLTTCNIGLYLLPSSFLAVDACPHNMN